MGNGDGEIAFSDFVAALIDRKVEVSPDLVIATFRKFDTDNTGFITAESIGKVIGESYEGFDASSLLAQARSAKKESDERVSLEMFAWSAFGKDLRVSDKKRSGGSIPVLKDHSSCIDT